MNRFFGILISASALLSAFSCAQENVLSTGQKAKEYLELAMSKMEPDITPDKWGIYVLEDTPGTGADWNSELSYSLISSTIRSLDGTIISTTDEALNKQLDQDSYKPYNYYGPRYQATSSGKGYAGLEYMLGGMKIGGTRTAVIPSWLLTNSRFSTLNEYIAACTMSTHLIYTITLVGQCEDIEKEEISILRKYVTEHYGESQKSTTFKSDQAEGVFYFVSDTTAFNEEDKRADDATLKVRYTGRRIDGVAFDTSVLDVALKEGLYDEERKYEDLSVVFSSTYSSISMGGSTSLISGFQGGLYKMHWAGQKAVVLFVSSLGYSSTGSDDIIPPYCPLIFELELLENK